MEDNTRQNNVVLKLLISAVVVVAAIAVLLAWLQPAGDRVDAASTGPEMEMVVSSGTTGCPGGTPGGHVCVLVSGSLTLRVRAIGIPAGGYIGVQTFVVFGPDLTYNSTGTAADEIVWPDCSSSTVVRAQFSAESVNHGCLTGLFPPQPVSNYSGDVVQLSFTCSPASSSTEVELLAAGDPFAASSGSGFAEPGTGTTIPAKVSNLIVDCVEPTPTPTNTPTNTPTDTPTNTPTPTNLPTFTPCPPEGCPTATPPPSGLKKVAIETSAYHVCALTGFGAVECWGGNEEAGYQPEVVAGLESGVVAIAAGYFHNCALKTTGGVFCWGSDTVGQLGNGNACGIACETPVAVTGLGSGVAAITAGGHHSCAITTAGALKCWGYNIDGQLGDGTTDIRNTPVDVVGLGSGVIAVEAGGHDTCALTTGGLKCWGSNKYGQAGDGTTDERYTPVNVTGLGSGVTAISKGIFNTCALTTAGGMKCWGDNRWGQLGIGTSGDDDPYRTTPVDVLGLTSGVAALGSGGSGEHICAITTSGGLKCWGRNHWGQVGDGTVTTRNVPVNVVGLDADIAAASSGSFFTCALQGGGATCWGQNILGQLAYSPGLGPEQCPGEPPGPCSKTPLVVDKGTGATPTATPCPGACPTATNTPMPPASYYVNHSADQPDAKAGDGLCATAVGSCTLRAAIQEVNANPGPDVIVSAGTYTLTAGQLSIEADLSLSGAGAGSTIVDGSSNARIFYIAPGATVEISGLTVRNGWALQYGGGISNGGVLTLSDSIIKDNTVSNASAGIHNAGTMTINNSTVSDNVAGNASAGIGNSGVMTINSSTISGNFAGNASAGIGNHGTGVLTINSSTISGNHANNAAGGINNGGGGVMTINNSTITGNSAGNAAGGVDNSTGGTLAINNSTIAGNWNGGIQNHSPMTMKNTLVANNGFYDCGGFVITSLGHNLDSDGTCGLTATGDISDADPLLGPLADNGGPTLTLALLPGSPAIDAGSSDCPPPANDQRGYTRPAGGTCDIGAFELGGVAPPPTPTPTPAPDSDGDGCTDQKENGWDPAAGGQRDMLDPWDFYDVAMGGGVQGRDGQVDLFNDVVGVINRYAPTGLEAEYDAWYDRGSSAGPMPWNMTAPDGKIDLFNDIVGVVAQAFHDCR